MKRLLTLIALLGLATSAVADEESLSNLGTRYFGSAANDDDLLFTATNSLRYDACMLMSTAGAVDVETTLDGTNWSAPMSLQDLGATSVDPVVVTAADRMYAVLGRYMGIRVRQNGATAASASLLCWKR